jgi:hypothetical protein
MLIVCSRPPSGNACGDQRLPGWSCLADEKAGENERSGLTGKVVVDDIGRLHPAISESIDQKMHAGGDRESVGNGITDSGSFISA